MKKIYYYIVPVLLAFVLCSCASVYAGKKVRYIELGSRDCYVCHRMDTVTDEIVSKYGKDVDFVSYTDTGDEGESLVKKYNVKKFPSNLIFDFKGNLVFRYDGLLDFRGVELQLIKQGISPYTAYNITPAAGVK